MKVFFHRSFEKAYKKLPERIQTQFKKRLALFCQNPFDPILNNHNLEGKFKECRSINVSGDIRALYVPLEGETAAFLLIGTHSDLYS